MKKLLHTTFTRRGALQALCAGLVTGGLSMLSSTQAQAAQSTLIVYYSRSGNTRAVAEQIHALTNGDMVEIQTVHPYPEDYRATANQAKKELAEGYRPPILTKIPDMGRYDRVFLGSPNWWSTVAPPVMSFLAEHDFAGKSIAPFMTHGGGGAGRSVADIRRLCPGAKVLEGLTVRGEAAATAHKDVAAWVRRLGDKG